MQILLQGEEVCPVDIVLFQPPITHSLVSHNCSSYWSTFNCSSSGKKDESLDIAFEEMLLVAPLCLLRELRQPHCSTEPVVTAIRHRSLTKLAVNAAPINRPYAYDVRSAR